MKIKKRIAAIILLPLIKTKAKKVYESQQLSY